MTQLSKDQEIAITLIQEWFTLYDAAYLAREHMVVWYGALDGDLRRQGWNKARLNDATNMIRIEKMPIGLIGLCTPALVQGAAQEAGRAYVYGTEIAGPTADNVFNYLHKTSGHVEETAEHRAAQLLTNQLELLDQHILWADLANLYERILLALGRPLPNQMARNKLLRYGLRFSNFRERRHDAKYNGRLTFTTRAGQRRQVTAISLEHAVGVKESWTDDERTNVIEKVLFSIRC